MAALKPACWLYGSTGYYFFKFMEAYPVLYAAAEVAGYPRCLPLSNLTTISAQAYSLTSAIAYYLNSHSLVLHGEVGVGSSIFLPNWYRTTCMRSLLYPLRQKVFVRMQRNSNTEKKTAGRCDILG